MSNFLDDLENKGYKTSEEESKKDYVFKSHTDKTVECFRLLNEVFDFFKLEYDELEKRSKEFPKFKDKQKDILTIAKALNTEDCKKAIKDGYRLYVTENKWLKD